MNTLKYLKAKFSNLSVAKKALLIFLALIMVGVAGWAGYTFGFKKNNSPLVVSPAGNIISGNVEEKVNFPNPINGILYKKSEAKAWINNLPLAVIIENSTDARPQTGYTKADIVYEALAEGGITRTLAVFLSEESDVGPVRSNRPYFIDWLSEYDAGYAHVGGSPEGQARVKAYGIKDLDQFFVGAPTYHRVGFRAAPHNVYTSTAELRAAADSRGYKKGADIVSWKFNDKEPPVDQRPKSFALSIGFIGAGGYDVKWVYKPESNTYARFNGGSPFMDALNNTQVEVKTVILQAVNYSYDPSGHGRLFMDTTGSGPCKIFLNGTVVDCTWKKDSRTARTKFVDAAGKEVALNRGKIWVEITPPESANTYP